MDKSSLLFRSLSLEASPVHWLTWLLCSIFCCHACAKLTTCYMHSVNLYFKTYWSKPDKPWHTISVIWLLLWLFFITMFDRYSCRWYLSPYIIFFSLIAQVPCQQNAELLCTRWFLIKLTHPGAFIFLIQL
jgi:hypothetical protein